MLDSWTFLVERGRIVLFGYVIMENHVHWIASADDLSVEIQSFKSFTTRGMVESQQADRATRLLSELQSRKARHRRGNTHQFWQDGSHPEEIVGAEMMRSKLEYVHVNPVRRGYVDDPVHWRYTSARDYAGLEGLVPVNIDW